MLRDPHVGDRDPRSEDRQLLLDALIAGDRRVIATYTGNDERTNTDRPPAVPVNELLDVVDRTVRAERRRRARRRRRPPPAPAVRPAQLPAAASSSAAAAWSFDAVTLEGARALEADRAPARRVPARARSSPSGRRPRGARRPRAVRRAPGAGVPAPAARHQPVGDVDDEVEDALRVELDGLAAWGVGHRLAGGACSRARTLRRLRPGRDRARRAAAGRLARPVVAQVRPDRAEHRRGVARSCPARRRAAGRSTSASPSATAGGWAARSPASAGDVLRTVTYSRARARGTGSRCGCGCSR